MDAVEWPEWLTAANQNGNKKNKKISQFCWGHTFCTKSWQVCIIRKSHFLHPAPSWNICLDKMSILAEQKKKKPKTQQCFTVWVMLERRTERRRRNVQLEILSCFQPGPHSRWVFVWWSSLETSPQSTCGRVTGPHVLRHPFDSLSSVSLFIKLQKKTFYSFFFFFFKQIPANRRVPFNWRECLDSASFQPIGYSWRMPILVGATLRLFATFGESSNAPEREKALWFALIWHLRIEIVWCHKYERYAILSVVS